MANKVWTTTNHSDHWAAIVAGVDGKHGAFGFGLARLAGQEATFGLLGFCANENPRQFGWRGLGFTSKLLRSEDVMIYAFFFDNHIQF